MNSKIFSKYFSSTNTFFTHLAEDILRWRWLLLIMVFILTIFAFYEMKTLRMDNSNESFFLEGDPTKLLLDKFRDTFGNEDFVYVLIETDDFFRADSFWTGGRFCFSLGIIGGLLHGSGHAVFV